VARSLLGLAGYLVVQYRPDGALAYSAISAQISQNFTTAVWRAVLQLSAYLSETNGLTLTFRRTGTEPAAFADSSALNGGEGHSWGGYCILRPGVEQAGGHRSVGSGATHYRCISPKQLADSSGGNELIMATLALKDLVAERIAMAELGRLPDGPHDLHLDAQVVLDGVAMDRVSRESRYLATKLAMLRQAVVDGVIRLVKVATKFNPADIFTKALVGGALRVCRALVLGHDIDDRAVVAALIADDGPMAWGERLKAKRTAARRAAAQRRAAETAAAPEQSK